MDRPLWWSKSYLSMWCALQTIKKGQRSNYEGLLKTLLRRDSLKQTRNQQKDTTQNHQLWPLNRPTIPNPPSYLHDHRKSKLDLHDIVDFNMTSNHWKSRFKICKILHLPSWGLEKYKLPCGVAFATYHDPPWQFHSQKKIKKKNIAIWFALNTI